MECIYFDKMINGIIEVSEDEAKHLRSLRLVNGDKVLATNGKGQQYICEVKQSSKYDCLLEVVEEANSKEYNNQFDLAIGHIALRDRMDFAVEKAVELGAKNIFIFKSRYTQPGKPHLERANRKSVVAMKQSHRSQLVSVNYYEKFSELLENLNSYKTIIIGDTNGEIPNTKNIIFPALLIIGAEGGLSDEEIKQIELESSDKNSNFIKWKLSKTRLRAETAAVAGLTIFSTYCE